MHLKWNCRCIVLVAVLLVESGMPDLLVLLVKVSLMRKCWVKVDLIAIDVMWQAVEKVRIWLEIGLL